MLPFISMITRAGRLRIPPMYRDESEHSHSSYNSPKSGVKGIPKLAVREELRYLEKNLLEWPLEDRYIAYQGTNSSSRHTTFQTTGGLSRTMCLFAAVFDLTNKGVVVLIMLMKMGRLSYYTRASALSDVFGLSRQLCRFFTYLVACELKQSVDPNELLLSRSAKLVDVYDYLSHPVQEFILMFSCNFTYFQDHSDSTAFFINYGHQSIPNLITHRQEMVNRVRTHFQTEEDLAFFMIHAAKVFYKQPI